MKKGVRTNNPSFSQRNQELEKQVREMERGLLERDRLISELRLRMPASADRDEVITKAQAKVTAAVQKAEDGGGDFESHQALKIAQSTVHSLQVTSNVYGNVIFQLHTEEHI